MLYLMPVLALVLLVTSVVNRGSASNTQSLKPFNTINITAPFNVIIRPADRFALDVTAEPQVVAALDVSVSDKTLHLGVHSAFSSQSPILCTVTLPATELAVLNVLSPAIVVVVDSGFSLPSFSVSVSGASKFVARDLRAAKTNTTSAGRDPLDADEACASLSRRLWRHNRFVCLQGFYSFSVRGSGLC